MIEVKKLQRWSAFRHDVWAVGSRLTRAEVELAIKEGRLESRPWSGDGRFQVAQARRARQYHIERIAFLVVNKDSKPLEIDVMDYDGWPLQDGHHRLAAAIFRGDEHIEANIGGDLKRIKKLFGAVKVNHVEDA